MELKPKSEARIQEDAFGYIRLNHPETYGCLWHVPNGGLRDDRTAATFAGQGLVAGIQDLHLLWHGQFYVIEVKTETGEVSADQKVIHAVHAFHGKMTYLLKSSEQIISFVEAVISGQPIDRFTPYISPFCKHEMIEIYKNEARELRKKKLQTRIRKRAA